MDDLIYGVLIVLVLALTALLLLKGRESEVLVAPTDKPVGSFYPKAPASYIQLSSGVFSTGLGVTTAKRVGGISFNPADFQQLTPTSGIVLHVLLETTNAANQANLQLFRYSGTGSPAVVTTVSTASVSAVEVTADVSSSFRPGQASGIFFAALYLTAASNVDLATCSSAWLEISP